MKFGDTYVIDFSSLHRFVERRGPEISLRHTSVKLDLYKDQVEGPITMLNFTKLLEGPFAIAEANRRSLLGQSTSIIGEFNLTSPSYYNSVRLPVFSDGYGPIADLLREEGFSDEEIMKRIKTDILAGNQKAQFAE